MKTFPLILILALAATGMVNAGSVTLTTAGGRQFASQSGGVLPFGVTIRVGTFNLPAATRDATLAATHDFNQLNAWFKPLGEAIAGAGVIAQSNAVGNVLCANGFPTTGEVFGTIANVGGSYIAAGTQLYVWMFDTMSPYDYTQWGIFTAAEWTMPQKLGARTLSTAAGVTALRGSVASTALRLGTPLLTYGNWGMKKFAPGSAAAITAVDADPDHDKLNNFAEYAWLLTPTSHDKERSDIASDAGGVIFTFKAPRNLPDVAVTAECSQDLLNWTAAPSSVVSSDADFDTRVCIAAPGAPRCFYRVRFAPVVP